MESQAFDIVVHQEVGVMVTTFDRFDDDTLADYVGTATKHPDFNRVSTRVLQLWDIDNPQYSYEGVRESLIQASRHSKEGVTTVVLTRDEWAGGIRRLIEVHRDAANFNLKISTDLEYLEELLNPEPQGGSIAERMSANLDKANALLEPEAEAEEPPASLILRNFDENLKQIDPAFAQAFFDLKKAYGRGEYFAASAGLRELMRRLVEGNSQTLQKDVIAKIESGVLTAHLVDVVTRKSSLLDPDAIGEQVAASTLMRLVTILTAYRMVLPAWVEEYVDEAASIEVGH